MMKTLRAAAVAFGLLLYSAAAMATMDGMTGMSDPGMYNLTVGGLAGGNDAKGVDKAFREMNGVEKVHVDFKNGMIMVWMKSGAMLDRGLAEKIVETAGFTLTGFDQPRE